MWYNNLTKKTECNIVNAVYNSQMICLDSQIPNFH